MKVDKHNLRHWVYLLRSGAYILVALLFRPLRPKNRKLVVLYGHKLNGNLKAFADYIEQRRGGESEYALAYATLDPGYYRELSNTETSVQVLSMNKLRDVIQITSSAAILTSHGLHTLAFLKVLTGIKFINVWHGIGWKGHDPQEFSFTNGYADNWVSSAAFKDVYRDVFGVKSPIHVTGYARSDDAVNGNFSISDIRERYGIGARFKKVILIAPTWEQKHGRHNIYPFGQSGEDFFRALNTVAKKTHSLIIFRSHLNTRAANPPRGLENLTFMPYSQYPVVEDFLYMADVLISDWSSIVFDYLPLKRPTIFFDVPSPYERLCIDEKYRFGAKPTSMEELIKYIETYILNPEEYVREHGADMRQAVDVGYGDTLDGKSSERYYYRLLELIK